MSDIPDVALDAIAAQLAEEHPDFSTVTARDAVQFVADRLVAAMEVAGGDPLGMIRRSDSGVVATRVMHGAIPAWQVVATDGSVGYDTRPTLDWPPIYTPGAPA